MKQPRCTHIFSPMSSSQTEEYDSKMIGVDVGARGDAMDEMQDPEVIQSGLPPTNGIVGGKKKTKKTKEGKKEITAVREPENSNTGSVVVVNETGHHGGGSSSSGPVNTNPKLDIVMIDSIPKPASPQKYTTDGVSLLTGPKEDAAASQPHSSSSSSESDKKLLNLGVKRIVIWGCKNVSEHVVSELDKLTKVEWSRR